MTTLAIKGMSTHAANALEDHIRGLYDNPDGKIIAVIELQHVSRTMPGPVSNAQPKVDARISLLEVPSGINQDLIRTVMRSLYLLRTSRGTLDEASGEVSLATESAKIADSIPALFASEAAEARAVLHQLLDQLDAATKTADVVKMRRRVTKLAAAGRSFLGTGDRQALAMLAQDAFDLSGDDDAPAPAEVDVEVSNTAGDDGSDPVRVGDVVPDVVPEKPQARKRAARKATEPAGATS